MLQEFEVGLELDSAEVRGVLLYNGVEWGRSVCIVKPLSGLVAKKGISCRVVFDFLV